jgi:ribosome recycling factor
MGHKEILEKFKPEMDKAVAFLDRELSKIRTSRATPALVEDIVVNCFGQNFPLKQLASISAPEARQILIQPWDKSYVEGIVSALSQTGTGANPIVDKDAIRISLPPLTEDYRKDLIKLVSAKEEEARQAVRRQREEAWSRIQTLAREGQIREDDKFRGKDELQKLIDEYNKKIDAVGEKKRKEISE